MVGSTHRSSVPHILARQLRKVGVGTPVPACSGCQSSHSTRITVAQRGVSRMFRLLRYFSLTSFVSILVVAVVLGVFYREIAVHSLIAMGESNNTALTQVLANSVRPTLTPYLATAEAMAIDKLKNHPGRSDLSAALLTLLHGLSVAKVKVYDVSGRTVFSTEPTQIGDDKSANAGFRQARAGNVTSELTHRDQFSAFDGVIENRDLLSTYIPVRRTVDGPIEAVFEVYDDVTPFLARI